jgi:hypothetical protein
MNRFFYVLTVAAFALLPSLSEAADLAIQKALAKAPAYPLDSSGCYFGINTEAAVAQSSNSGTGLLATSLVTGSLTAAGGAVGGSVGCIKGTPSQWVGIHASLDWQNITGNVGTVAGANNIASRIQGGVAVRWGGFGTVMNWLQGLNLGLNFPVVTQAPVAPAGVTFLPGGAHPYFMAGVEAYNVNAAFGVVTGNVVEIAPMVGAGVLNPIADSTGKATGAVFDTYAKVIFAGRGGAFSNGAFTASANMGTEYRAGAAIYW